MSFCLGPLRRPARSGTARTAQRAVPTLFAPARARNSQIAISIGFALLTLSFVGCRGTATLGEKQAREQAQAVAGSYRPQGEKPPLPLLTTNSPLSEFLAYALLNQPRVEAAYFDWLSSIERITVERSLPDPQLTFQMDIQEVVTSLMPGLMMSFPGKGKLKAAGAVATAESEAKYFAFKSASLQSAYEVERAYLQLYFLEEKIRVNRESLRLLDDLGKLALAQNEVGKVTLQDVLRAQIEQDRLQNDILNLEDSGRSLRIQFKAALGLGAGDPAPPLPQRFDSIPLDLSSDALLETALQHNTRLKAMEADVHAAEAAIALAYKARMPDSSLGLMADVKMSPTLYRPLGTITLPLWRDKLEAQVAQAQASKRAGEARLSAEQIALAVEFAERSFLYREASRSLELLQNQLLPKQRQSLEVARSGYLAGRIDFFNLTDAEQTLLRFGLDQVEARTQRELSLVELTLLAQGLSPSGAPMARGAGGASGSPSSSPKSLSPGGMTTMK
jgi:outer membrane protein TolC